MLNVFFNYLSSTTVLYITATFVYKLVGFYTVLATIYSAKKSTALITSYIVISVAAFSEAETPAIWPTAAAAQPDRQRARALQVLHCLGAGLYQE